MRAARTDTNQADIIRDLKRAGIRVWDTHRLGDGFPDIVVFVPRTQAWLPIEIKSASGKLTGAERAFWLRMGVEPIIARNSQEAMAAVGVEVT